VAGSFFRSEHKVVNDATGYTTMPVSQLCIFQVRFKVIVLPVPITLKARMISLAEQCAIAFATPNHKCHLFKEWQDHRINGAWARHERPFRTNASPLPDSSVKINIQDEIGIT
jgi:hypothetical protein